jgi:hypothetical protein
MCLVLTPHRLHAQTSLSCGNVFIFPSRLADEGRGNKESHVPRTPAIFQLHARLPCRRRSGRKSLSTPRLRRPKYIHFAPTSQIPGKIVHHSHRIRVSMDCNEKVRNFLHGSAKKYMYLSISKPNILINFIFVSETTFFVRQIMIKIRFQQRYVKQGWI